MDFVREHHTWGLISESGLEHLHHQINKLEMRFLSLRNTFSYFPVLNCLFDRDFDLKPTDDHSIGKIFQSFVIE